MKHIGKNIKRLRAYKELSQDDLAKLLGCSLTIVGQWEINNMVPSLKKLVAMRDIFGVNLDKLVCGEVKLGIVNEGELDGSVTSIC